MRVDVRVIEERVDPVDQPLGGRVLHVLGLLVHLVPRHVQGLHEEQLEQAVPTDHLQRQPFTRRSELRPLVWGIRRQVCLGERLEHPRDRARRYAHGLGKLARADPVARAVAAGDEGDRLEVILDGQARHDGPSRRKTGVGNGTPAADRRVPAGRPRLPILRKARRHFKAGRVHAPPASSHRPPSSSSGRSSSPSIEGLSSGSASSIDDRPVRSPSRSQTALR